MKCFGLCVCLRMFTQHARVSSSFPMLEILFIVLGRGEKKKKASMETVIFVFAYISVMNRDIFPLPLQIFINDTSAQFTLKCIFSHRGFLCLSWYLSNWETLKNGNVLTQQARRIQIILFLPLCGNNVNIYRSGKLSGVFNE